MRQGESVLCVLFRKNGLDMRFYESYGGEIFVDSKNVASISGGELYRNHYNESENFIVMKVATVAFCFSKGIVRDELRTQDGRSYKLNQRYQVIREHSSEAFQRRSQEMREAAEQRSIYKYIRDDCGGYMGDGQWL